MAIWFQINIISALFIIVPAFAALSRIKTMRPSFLPLLIILAAGFCNELLGLMLIYKTGDNTALYNSYALVYGLLVLWQFHRWVANGRFSLLLKWNAVALTLSWIVTFLFFGGLRGTFTLFLLLRDFSIAVFCLRVLYERMAEVLYKVYQDAVSMISAGWLLIFLYDGITELLLVYGGPADAAVLFFVRPLFAIINLLALLIHLYAILCIPPARPC